MKGLMKILGSVGAAALAYYFLEPSKGPQRRKKLAKDATDLYNTAVDEVTRAGRELGRLGTDLAGEVGSGIEKISGMVSSATSGGSGSSSRGSSSGSSSQGSSSGSSSSSSGSSSSSQKSSSRSSNGVSAATSGTA